MEIRQKLAHRLRGATAIDADSVPAVADRLGRLPRYQSGTTRVLDRNLHYVDGPSAAVQLRDLFLRGAYDFALPGSTPTIIDGGANIGLAAIRWLQLFPGASVDCFEPDPEVFASLSSNLGSDPGVTLHQLALWREAGPLRFAQAGGDGGRVEELDSTEVKVASVQAVTLRTVLARLGSVDLLKLDIEGAEWAVLDAARGCLDKVDRIIVEYHSFTKQPQQLPELLAFIVDEGFRLHMHTDDAAPKPLVEVPSLMGMDFQANIFAWRDS